MKTRNRLCGNKAKPRQRGVRVSRCA
jgi:hypothetical protein